MTILGKTFNSPGMKWVILGFVLVFWYFDYWNMMLDGPQSMHTWRQTDSATQAQNYYYNGFDFFNPQVNNLNISDGKAASEFPIFYFLVALGWKIFGMHEFVFHAVWLLVSLFGVYHLFRLCSERMNTLQAFLVSFFIFTSPTYLFYFLNYIPDPLAFAFVWPALRFTVNGYEAENKNLIRKGTFFWMLAGLLKPTYLILYFAYFGGDFFSRLIERKKLPVKQYLVSASALIAPFCWFYYVKNVYNLSNGNTFFSNTIRPFWDLTEAEIANIIHRIGLIQINFYFSIDTLYILPVIILLAIIYRFKSFLKESLILIFSILGSFAFILLWFLVFGEHDYYVLTLMPVVIYSFYLLTIKLKDKSIFGNFEWNYLFIALLGFMLIKNINHQKEETKERYVDYGWMNTHSKKFKSLEALRPALEKLGITRQTHIGVTSDDTPNTSLYYLHRMGITLYGDNTNPDNFYAHAKRNNINHFIQYDRDSSILRYDELELIADTLKLRVYKTKGL